MPPPEPPDEADAQGEEQSIVVVAPPAAKGNGRGRRSEEEIQAMLDSHILADEGTHWKCVACGRRRQKRGAAAMGWCTA